MIVFLTALDLEYQAVRDRLADLRPHPVAGTVFEVGTLADRPDCPVAVAVIGAGNLAAAAVTQRAITEFTPKAVIFVGVAGGLKRAIGMGDIVVGTRIYSYHSGRQEPDGFHARPRAWESSHELLQQARYLVNSGAWRGAAVHFESIAAGEVVLNSSASPLNEQLRWHYEDAAAIEMESAGVAQTAHVNDGTPTITVRGICDHADGRKNPMADLDTQPTAAANAASFATSLASSLAAAVRCAGATSGRRDQAASLAIDNSAEGESTVGVQAGVIHGNVALGSFPGDTRGNR
jgi:8-oxo-dGTP diphosphatase